MITAALSIWTARTKTVGELRKTDSNLAAAIVVEIRRERLAGFLAALATLSSKAHDVVVGLHLEGVPGAWLSAIQDGLRAQHLDAASIAQVMARAERAQLDTAMPDDQVVGAEPALATVLAQGRLQEVLAAAGLTRPAVDAIADSAGSTGGVSDALLAKLVGSHKLSEAQARAVGMALALYEVLEADATLVTAARTTVFASLGGHAPASIADLARIEAAEWAALFAAHGAPATAAQRGAAVRARLARFASAVLLDRLPATTADALAIAVAALTPVYAKNPQVAGVPYERLDLSGLSTEAHRHVQTAHYQVHPLVMAYPGLGLAALVDDQSRPPKARAEQVAQRVTWTRAVVTHAGDAILQMDLARGRDDLATLKVADTGASPAEQDQIVAVLRGYQRMTRLTRSMDDAVALIGKGFHAAMEIARLPASAFAAASGLEPEAAQRHWASARAMMADVSLAAGGILDGIHDRFGDVRVSNVPPTVAQGLAQIDNVAAMFGDLSYCDCDECQSLLGPAAYFVDLMTFIDEQLRGRFAATPGHPIDLKTRRPDLWSVELTCANTSTRVPTLDLVNEILENFIAQHLGYAGSLADRAAVGALVYGKALVDAVDSIQQPFAEPLTRVDAYLASRASSRAAVAVALDAPLDTLTAAALRVSARERAIITTPDAALGHLGRVYGIAFTGTADAIDDVDAAALGRALGLSREDLATLVAAGFARGTGAPITIVGARRTSDSLQNDVEWVRGLTAARLDCMHRVTRLHARAGWTFPEVDLALSALGDTTLTSLDDLARLQLARERLGVPVAVVVALLAQGANWAPLASALAMTPDELAQLGELAGLAGPLTPSQLITLLNRVEEWRASGYRLDDLAIASGQAPRDLSRRIDPTAAAARLVASSGLAFKDTLFALAIGTTEEASRAILAANPSLVEAGSDTWRLVAGVALDTIAIAVPAGATVPVPPSSSRAVTVDEIRAALRPHHASTVAIAGLAALFRVSSDELTALAALANVPLDTADVARAIRGDGPIGPMAAAIRTLQPLAVAFASPAWDAAAIGFARTNATTLSTTPLPHVADSAHGDAPWLDLDQLRALATAARLGAVDPASLREALAAFDLVSRTFPPTADAALAQVLGVSVATATALRTAIALPPLAIAAVDRLDRAARLAASLGIAPAALAAIGSDDPILLTTAADALLDAIAARGATPVARATARTDVDQSVREARRDALVAYLLRSIAPARWHSRSELYAYFLIDVDAGGCASTSRVVAATGSAQLYVHRAIMHLESDDLPANDPGHVEVTLSADAAAQWPWRRAFRVWQANRKVFLWPENYLEPDLRDDKTPLFEALEQTLLQTEISDQQVTDAYTTYLTGLEQLASLAVAGAYHDVGTDSDTLHVIGVTAADPLTHYYRTCTGLRASGRDPNTAAQWTAWRQIPVSINARRVAPVVHEGRLHVFWVEISSRSVSQIANGESTFTGYRHTMRLRLTTLRPDATWTPPQEIVLTPGGQFGPSRGQVDDVIDGHVARLDLLRRSGNEPVDDYTLSGPNWDGVWPESRPDGLQLQLRDFVEFARVDLFERATLPPLPGLPTGPVPTLLCWRTQTGATRPLMAGVGPGLIQWPQTGYANALIDESRLDQLDLDVPLKHGFGLDRYTIQVATLPSTARIGAVPGAATDALIEVGRDLLHLQQTEAGDGHYVLRRLGSTVVRGILRQLFEDGLGAVLDTRAQLALAEASAPFTISARVANRAGAGTLDYAGPFGVYLRELYLHIPFLIASALNARGRFAAAQRWYHVLFDPTATEVIDVSGVPPAEAAHRLLDRVWRYREFRGHDLVRVRAMLSDAGAIAAYRDDPFNPWAIARRRISAVQKALVMRYVDNLIDWADSLFRQFTMETVNEARMLYALAADLLGPRPEALGDCGTGITPMTYEAIAARATGDDFLIELETWIAGARRTTPLPSSTGYTVAPGALAHAIVAHPVATLPTRAAFRDTTRRVRTTSWGPAQSAATTRSADPLGGRTFGDRGSDDFASAAAPFGHSIVRQLSPAFCVPMNPQLLGCWDRLDDRLYKLGHCMDLDGNRRALALFAPPIDPVQLVAMKAAGLSLDDVLGGTASDLPPYRFLYLIDRAKAFASSLAGFGGAMLSALDRRDAEQLNRVRLTQQINLTQLTTQVRELEIRAANEALASAVQQRDAAQYRKDYYASLRENGLNTWELAEAAARHGILGQYLAGIALYGLEGVHRLIAQVGSPFSMKWGGHEIGGSLHALASASIAGAAGLDAAAASSGLQAGFKRRADDWKHQQELATRDVAVLDRQVTAAQIRVDIATRSLVTHQQSIDQLNELLEMADDRFTNLGLYTWLATQLQRLYRGAYQNALALAALAERAFRFERGDDTGPGLSYAYWSPGQAGLLAGEQLLLELQTLERRFLETHYRTLEVDQPFALSQIAPDALVALRETGECVIDVPEVFFDLTYPGQYKRRLKAVRLTIPCITGPYVNVGATLALEQSWLRPRADSLDLVDVPASRVVAIATSTAQNDAGVFELSFRDERYLPFEGAGAISRWRLTLPKAFRPFDYQTITDVVLSLAYSAEHDGALRAKVESQNAALEGSIRHHLATYPVTRVISLRQDASAAFTRLVRSPVGTAVTVELSDRNFPLFVAGLALQIDRASLVVRATGSTAGLALAVDGELVTGFAPDPALGELHAAALPAMVASGIRGKHTLTVTAPGGLASPADPTALTADALHDLLIVVAYRLA